MRNYSRGITTNGTTCGKPISKMETERHRKWKLPTSTMDGRWNLTPAQRNLLIILEDATLMFIRDEVIFLRNLPEVNEGSDNIVKGLCSEIIDELQKRIREVRRGWGKERTEMYEERLLEVVDACDVARGNLRREMRTALVQKIKYQNIPRAEHIATAAGLTESAARIHEWLTQKKHKYDGIRERLEEIDKRMECRLLNEGRLPDMREAQKSFGVLFDSLCMNVLYLFTEKKQGQ